MFLTVQEAIDLCGRSQTTVHRLCQKYDGSKFIKKENNKYFVDSEFLLEKYPVEKGTETAIAAFAENNEIPEKIMETNISESKENNLFYENQLKEKDSEIERLKEELLDSHQDLAEVTEANLQIQKELAAAKHIEFTSNSNSSIDETEKEKKLFRYRAIGVTISVMVLISFIFAMYHLTN